MKNSIRTLAASYFTRVALFSLIAMNTQLFGQDANRANRPAATAKPKSTANSKARMERVANGIDPIDLTKGKAPVRLDILKLMNLYNVPGLSVAVIEDYKIAWTKCYGVTEPGGTVPVTPKTLFQAGKLSLDGDVNVKLKSWKVPENEFTKDQKVTLRRLASHGAGLTVHGFPGYDVDDKIPTLVQIFDGEKPANTAAIRVDFVPGSDERYSGGGITIEQQLMIDVSGKPFPELMKETVLDKIGMRHSGYEQRLPPASAASTAGGTYGDGKLVHGKWHVYPEMAAAGLWTTPTDLAKFAIEIALSRQGKSNKVLTQKTAEEMLTMQSKNFGIGFGLSKDHPGEFEHNGADEGFQALLKMNSDTGQGVALMANSDYGILVAEEFLRSLAKEYNWKYKPRPRSEFLKLELVGKVQGVDAMLAKYDELKTSSDAKNRPEERVLNGIGYDYLRAGKMDDTIRIFQKNVAEFPESSNVYDSLGEAYAAAGKKELAIG